MKEFGHYISDHQVYHALQGLGWSVTDDGLTKDFISAPKRGTNDCTSLLTTLSLQKSVSYCILVENLVDSTETKQVFQTYLKKSGSKEYVLVDDEYDGTDCCKSTAPPTTGAASLHGEQSWHGRVYDASRLITVNGETCFFISVVWMHDRELRNFSAYPEVLVMDDKKKTNKHHHSFFAAIGVDAMWRNNTLLRSWSPNNTHDALNWMMKLAFVHLVPARVRSRIKCVFTDHCGVMTPILAKICGDKDVLPNAKHYLCIYHVVRNFFQEFGQGHNKKFQLRASTQKYRKGGDITWAYAWQKNCASSIFRLGVCESKEEFDACKKHILDYIRKTKDIGHSSVRDDVLRFFAKNLRTLISGACTHACMKQH